MKAQEYADWIGSYGLAPAISLFSSPFDETINIADEHLEGARPRRCGDQGVQPVLRRKRFGGIRSTGR
jgi:hypothetical protein